MNEATALYQIVSDFLKEIKYRFEEVPTDTPNLKIARADIQGDNGGWSFYIEAHEDTKTVICYSMLGGPRIPEARRPAVAEFLTRANYGLILGNFEMDFADGETRYKTSINVAEDRLTSALLRPLVLANEYTFDRYLLGVTRVAFGDKEPKVAIDEIEGARSATS
jgi:hypothetical protein